MKHPIVLIAAMASNRAIGLDNKLLWKLPADMAYFRSATMGNTVLMGRKTYESIGKPLPGRKNVILTSQQDYVVEGCQVIHSVDEALALSNTEPIYIIGGAEVYKQFMPYADRILLTFVQQYFDGDTFFPEVDLTEWELISDTAGETNEKNPYVYSFQVYYRNVTSGK
jgi:dihydrofolate reductase